jgi:tetratricopeptide (TPR) repeat protein
LAARLLEQLGHDDDAEAIYRAAAAASKQPEAVLTLAQHLSRRHIAEALDLCEKAWKTCPADKVAVTSVIVLRRGNAGKEAYRRVDSWLADAVAKRPDVHVLLAQAELCDMRGSYDDAIRVYRQALKDSGKNIMALNNLAYLLAMTGAHAEALTLAQQAIAIVGPHPEILDTRAIVLLKAGKADAALADLTKATAQAPTAAMYLHLAQAQQLAGKTPAAVAALRKATDLGLQLAKMHPLERPAYEQLDAALNGNGQRK